MTTMSKYKAKFHPNSPMIVFQVYLQTGVDDIQDQMEVTETPGERHEI